MSGKVQSPNGLSEAVSTSTIGVKEGCPLSPTLIDLYIDEVSHYIDSGFGSMLAGMTMQILLYADANVLIFESPVGLQRHLNP